jgi:hypothetical protein
VIIEIFGTECVGILMMAVNYGDESFWYFVLGVVVVYWTCFVNSGIGEFGNMTRCITKFSDVFGRLILSPDVHCGSCGDAKVDLIAGFCGWAGM